MLSFNHAAEREDGDREWVRLHTLKFTRAAGARLDYLQGLRVGVYRLVWADRWLNISVDMPFGPVTFGNTTDTQIFKVTEGSSFLYRT